MAGYIQFGKLKSVFIGMACCLLFAVTVLAVSGDNAPQKTVAEMAAEVAALMAQGRDTPGAYEKFQQLVEQIATVYRTDPASDEGYAAIKFIGQVPWLSQQAYPLLTRYHMDKPDIHQFMTKASSWSGVWEDKVIFLKEAIKQKNTNSLTRTKARLALAQDYLIVSELLSSLDEFGITAQEFINQEMQRAEAVQSEEVTEPINFQVTDIVQKGYLYARVKTGKTPDWRDLQQRAEVLLAKAGQEAAATELVSVQQTPQGEIKTSESERILKEVANINRLFEHTAPGSVVPNVENLVNYDGDVVQLSNHRGKVLMLDFWATWCGPCVASMPDNSKLAEHMKDRPFELITFSVDGDMEDAAEFMEENGYPFTNWYIGPDHAMLSDWGISAYPTVIVIDHKGIIRARPRVDHELLEPYIEKLVMEAEQR